MPRLLTETPIGYRIELDDGQVYDVDRNAAQQSFPDLFPSAGTAYVDAQGGVPTAGQPMTPMPAQQPQQPMGGRYFGSPDMLPPESTFQPFAPGGDVLGGQLDAPTGEDTSPPWLRRGMVDQSFSMDDARQMSLKPGQSVSMSVPRVKMGVPVPPSAEEQLGNVMPGYEMMQEGLNQRGEAMWNQAQVGYDPAMGPTYEQVGQEEQQLSSDLAERDTWIDEQLAQREAAIQQKLSQVSQMDPKRFFKNADTYTGVMNTIAAGFAGFLSPTGPNQVIENVMRQVDQDLEAQRTDIETQKFQVQGMESSYLREANRFANQRSAMLEQRSMKIQALINGIEREKGKYNSDIVLGTLMEAQGQLSKELGSTLNALGQQEHENLFKIYSLQQQLRAQYATAASRRSKEEKPKDDRIIFRMASPTNPKIAADIRVRENSPYESWDESTRNKWQQEMSLTEGQLRAVNEYLDVIKTAKGLAVGSGKDWLNAMKGDTALATRYQAAKAVMAQQFIRPLTGAATSEHEIKMYEDMIPQIHGIILDKTGNAEVVAKLYERIQEQRADHLVRAGAYMEEVVPVETPYVKPDQTPYTAEEIAMTAGQGVYSGTRAGAGRARTNFEPGNALDVVRGGSAPVSRGQQSPAEPTALDRLSSIKRLSQDIRTGTPGERYERRLQLREEIVDLVDSVERGRIDLSYNPTLMRQVEETIAGVPKADRTLTRPAKGFEDIKPGDELYDSAPKEHIDPLKVLQEYNERASEQRYRQERNEFQRRHMDYFD